jgi:hypothetical protein
MSSGLRKLRSKIDAASDGVALALAEEVLGPNLPFTLAHLLARRRVEVDRVLAIADSDVAPERAGDDATRTVLVTHGQPRPVEVHHRRLDHLVLKRPPDRPQQIGRPLDLIRHRRAGHGETEPLEALAETIKRLAVPVLADHQMPDQA